jgi:hypothetical protein
MHTPWCRMNIAERKAYRGEVFSRVTMVTRGNLREATMLQRLALLPANLRVAKFLGALRGAHDRLDEGDAESAFFEFENAVDGAAGGRGDLIF